LIPAITVIRMSGASTRAELPLLVLGPSLGSSAAALWTECASRLTEHFDVLAWDLPGHGYNRGVPDEDFTMAELASGVLRVVDEVLVQRSEMGEGAGGVFAYAGVGVGGAVGLQLLLDAPERVASAVLLDTSAHGGTSPSYDVRDRLGEVVAPVLALGGGAADATALDELRAVADGVSDGELELIDDVADSSPAESPEAVAALIRRHFLGEEPAPAAGGEPALRVHRTPDECFVDLPGYAFAPHYADVVAEDLDPIRMHYLDEGPADGPVVLLLHGQPTWSYLYRSVIPVLVDAGLRVIAPDNIGFGRSDKPAHTFDYTLARHIGWLRSLVTGLDLRDITLVAQDWGGPIGLSVLAEEPERFARVVAANTILHTADPALAGRLEWAVHGEGDSRVVIEESLLDYLLYTQRAPELRASDFVGATTTTPLAPDVLAAYDAPFPTREHTAGLRQMTALLPLTRNDPGARIGRRTMRALEAFEGPFVTAYSDGDPATRGWETIFAERVPGARGRNHVTIAGAGHFLQEDAGAELGRVIVDVVTST
jgi:haloalkane dehalogenase